MTNLGRLERIELRDIWKTEDQDFTPWLAREENIELLADTLGLELDVEAEEKRVGPFRADILCKNRNDDSWVLIENQLERTDHKHLGQLMTYAAGLRAVTIVWVAARFTEEHRAAIDWLNGITEEGFNFFALEVELWRIAESPAAPKFNVVSKPNEWSKSVNSSKHAIEEGQLSPVQQLRTRYWDFLCDHMEGHPHRRDSGLKKYSWLRFPINKAGFHLAALANTRENWIGFELYLRGEWASAHFDELFAMREEIESEIGFDLEWRKLPDKQDSRILIRLTDAPIGNENRWSEYADWMVEKLDAFNSTFRQRVRELDPESFVNEEADE